MKQPIHFIALINYFKTEDGGLITPISSGFRSEIKFPFETKPFVAAQNFSDTDLVFPGDSATIEITLFGAEQFLNDLYKGIDFELYNNSGIIGNGIITEVV